MINGISELGRPAAALPAPALAAKRQRVLIFIVAYNAHTTLEWVLDRIPAELRRDDVEVLIIDDSSQDDTFQCGLDYVQRHPSAGVKVTVLRNPENQGYGGNQKLGYRYAIDNGFDVVALLHGDGQYAPEKLPDLLAPLLSGEADAVFGSRMMTRGGARAGGMPAYKYVGNKILTRFQNALLGSHLSEFHSGYRLYSTRALSRIPFERNTNDFHFDTEIIIQLVLAGQQIVEVPIPTYYGDEVCRVNGMKYAWDVCKTMLRVRFHAMNLLYDRKFDVGSAADTYGLKLGYPSSHTWAIDAARPGSTVLDVGSGPGYVMRELARKSCKVTGMDQQAPAEPLPENASFIRWNLDNSEFPIDVSRFDQVLLLDIIDQLKDPDRFMEELRFATRCQRPEIILTTANIGFFVTRLMLLCGWFNYGRRGILDRTHIRLFTFGSIQTLLRQAGYQVIETRGIPAPFPVAVNHGRLGRFLLWANQALIRVSRGLFAYQIYVKARALPAAHHILERTVRCSGELRDKLAA